MHTVVFFLQFFYKSSSAFTFKPLLLGVDKGWALVCNPFEHLYHRPGTNPKHSEWNNKITTDGRVQVVNGFLSTNVVDSWWIWQAVTGWALGIINEYAQSSGHFRGCLPHCLESRLDGESPLKGKTLRVREFLSLRSRVLSLAQRPPAVHPLPVSTSFFCSGTTLLPV